MSGMILFEIVLVVLFVLFSCRITNKLTRIIALIFVLLYGIQLIVAIYDPYKVMKISMSTIIFFNLQIIFFIVGVLSIKERGIIKKEYQLPFVSRGNILVFLNTIYLIYSYYNYNRMQDLVSNEMFMVEGRNIYFTDFFQSYSLQMVDTIITSYKFCAIIISLILLLSPKIRFSVKNIYIITTPFLAATLQALTTMGRGEIMFVLWLFLFFAILCRIKLYGIYKKRIVPTALIITVVVFFSFLITSLIRFNITIEEIDYDALSLVFVEPVIKYFYCPILAFDYGINKLFTQMGPYLGLADLAGFWDFCLLPFQILSKSFNEYNMNGILGKQMSVFFSFPSGQTWNAFFTGSINYYLDFGMLGTAICPFIQGRLLSRCSKNIDSPHNLFFLVLIFWCSYRTIFSSPIQSIAIVFNLVWVWIVFRLQIINEVQSCKRG